MLKKLEFSNHNHSYRFNVHKKYFILMMKF